MWKSLAASVLIAGSATMAAAQSGSAAQETQIEAIAAVVNDEPISFTDVRERVGLLIAGFQTQPTDEILQQITADALEQLIEERLKLQEAAQFDLQIPADDIERELRRLADQTGVSVAQLREELRAAGVNPTSLEDQMRADIAWRTIMGGRFGSRIRISDNQIDDQLERLINGAKKTQYLLSEIFLFAPDPQSKAQATTALNQMREQLLQGASFQTIAQRFSFSSTASTGGDMGWLPADELDEALAAVVTASGEPGLLGPIETSQGVYLLAIRGKRDPQSDSPPKVVLHQLIATDGSSDTLQRATRRINGCSEIEQVAADSDNLLAVALGRIGMEELSDQTRRLIDATEIGEPSDELEISAGLSTLYVCDRRVDHEGLPSRDQIQNTLYSRELGMISSRELRNLERNAMIIRR